MTNVPSFGGEWTDDKLLRLKKYLKGAKPAMNIAQHILQAGY